MNTCFIHKYFGIISVCGYGLDIARLACVIVSHSISLNSHINAILYVILYVLAQIYFCSVIIDAKVKEVLVCGLDKIQNQKAVSYLF